LHNIWTISFDLIFQLAIISRLFVILATSRKRSRK